MAKKSFSTSPLMNFITPAAPAAEGQESAAAELFKPAAPKAPQTAKQTGTPGADQSGAAAPAKKPRKEDPSRQPEPERARIAEQDRKSVV